MKIGQKLILGYLGIVILVGVVGHVGFNSNNTIKGLSSIMVASKTLMLEIADAEETLYDCILNEDPDKLSQIKAEHDKYEKRIEMWIKALGHGTDSDEFKAKNVYKTWIEDDYNAKGINIVFNPEIAEMAKRMEEPFKNKREAAAALIAAHDDKLAAKAKFNEEYPKEKEKRHAITDFLYKSNSKALLKDIGQMIYYSKEALYQYGDKEHIDEWLASIETLKAAAAAAMLTPDELSRLSASLDEYYATAKTMAKLTLDIKQKEIDERTKLAVVDECAVKLDKKKAGIEEAVSTLMKETRAAVTTMLIGVAVVSLVLAIGLGLFVSRSISLPIAKLRHAAGEIGKGKLGTRIEIKSKDEIGELAESFSRMANDLSVSMQKEKELAAVAETDRKKAEDAIKAEQEKFVNAINVLSDIFFVLDLNGKLVIWNKALEEITQYSKEEISDMRTGDFFVEDEKEKMFNAITAAIEKGYAVLEVNILTKSRNRIPYSFVGKSLKDEEGKTIGVTGIGRDVTDRKKAEEKIKIFSQAAESADDSLVLTDMKGNVTYANESAIKIFGYSPEEIIKLNVGQFSTNPEVAVKIINEMKTKGVWSGESVGIRKNKETFPLFLTTSLIKDDKGNLAGMMGIFRDITEIKRLIQKEKELAVQAARAETDRKRAAELEKAYRELKSTQTMLVQSVKMAAIGQLASGIAHEIKNPLAIIIQWVDYLEDELGPDKKEEHVKALNVIKETVMRSDKIMRGLLGFARVTPLELKPCEINKVIEASLNLVEKQLTFKNIKIAKDFGVKLPSVMVDENQIGQVFINIILNSIQAMLKGGELTIRTYTEELKELKNGIGRRATDFFQPGKVALICEVEDTGMGIPEDKLSKVFDPFFTARLSGEGTGLGLAITRSIVEKHSGFINIESQVGKGTKVIITLPTANGG